MALKAEQHSQIAEAYQKAAADESLPSQSRAAFARKADWFRLLARVEEKKQRARVAARETAPRRNPLRPLPNSPSTQHWNDGGSFAERLLVST